VGKILEEQNEFYFNKNILKLENLKETVHNGMEELLLVINTIEDLKKLDSTNYNLSMEIQDLSEGILHLMKVFVYQPKINELNDVKSITPDILTIEIIENINKLLLHEMNETNKLNLISYINFLNQHLNNSLNDINKLNKFYCLNLCEVQNAIKTGDADNIANAIYNLMINVKTQEQPKTPTYISAKIHLDNLIKEITENKQENNKTYLLNMEDIKIYNNNNLNNSEIIEKNENLFDSIQNSLVLFDLFEYNKKGIKYDSYIVNDKNLIPGSYRILETDLPLIFGIKQHIRLLITSSDVLHSFAVPALGIKMDACPGRLNQLEFFLRRKGRFYGQCSEICGVNHSFMPITVLGVEYDEFKQYFLEFHLKKIN
jgi:heme/copper-type cytochrome/quinol oxidase subunit 2/ribosomal protein S6